MTKAVVITGASTGIGEACALYLDSLGYRVFAGVRKEADAAKLKEKATGELIPLFIDVTNTESIEKASQTVTEAVGEAGLVGLINNAGITVTGPLEFLPVDRLRWQFEVNVFGLIKTTQTFLPLIRQGQGRVINIGSIGGKLATPFVGPYSASKFALEALTDALRIELSPWNIEVVVIEPGSIDTPIWEKTTQIDLAMWDKMPTRAHELYDDAVDALVKSAKKSAKRGIPPQAVADVVLRALTASPPKTRYVVGPDAKVQAVLAAVPDRVRDKLIMKEMGLTGLGPNSDLAPVDSPAKISPKVLTGVAFGAILGSFLLRRKRKNN